jgi:uncharacterized protein (TIRG00374 family)
VIGQGFAHTAVWFNPLDVLVSLLTGSIAWGVASLAFVYLAGHLGFGLPPLLAISIYPIAMLAGAASMLPGGIGSTEAALVFLLVGLGVGLGSGILAAIGIRLASIWFATLLGMLAMTVMELARVITAPQRPISPSVRDTG